MKFRLNLEDKLIFVQMAHDLWNTVYLNDSLDQFYDETFFIKREEKKTGFFFKHQE